MTRTARLALPLAILLAPAAAHAQCVAGKPGAELTGAEAQELYTCLEAEMHAGYIAGDKRWIPEEFVTNYRGWVQASTFPAAPGFHGGRFLLTWVNETGAEAYMEYAENPDIPAGTVIAKESFSVNDAGEARPGPLFIMQKTEPGASEATDDWYYMMVGPDGAPQAVDVMTACSDCHQGTFGHQGGLGYPVEEARVTE